MEIYVYANLDARASGKSLFCCRVVSPACFSFEKAIDVFRSIYGSSVVIDFLVYEI